MKENENYQLPEYIKQDGYIARWNGVYYHVEYVHGGHFPKEDEVLLTEGEMKIIYEDSAQFDKIVTLAKNCSQKEVRASCDKISL